jgi:hypothetical protein
MQSISHAHLNFKRLEARHKFQYLASRRKKRRSTEVALQDGYGELLKEELGNEVLDDGQGRSNPSTLIYI